jgi:YYY domain-containing protein
MIPFILWYIVLLVLGLVTFPLAYTLLPKLPGRGYTLSRTFGLLLWGYVFWLFGSLGILQNNLGGILFSLAAVISASIFALRKTDFGEIRSWFVEHRAYVIVGELVFLAAFAGWAFVRSANPEITATEKPMELAFINAVLRSPTFPPHDPWLAGYAISYYYFGYVLVGLLAKLTGTVAGIAFNLGVALVFGLAAAGIFGLVYDFLSVGGIPSRGHNPRAKRTFLALMGPVYTLLVSNAVGFLELLHARGVFWQMGANGALRSNFWSWLDLKDLVNPPVQPFSPVPGRYLWWWRASRVINDVSFTGGQQEVIDEFPFFSFLLADLHPHVLAIPFAFLAVALAFNLFLGGFSGRFKAWILEFDLSPTGLLVGGLVLGGMAFLNTWDFPIYVALFAGAYILQQALRKGWRSERLWEFFTLGFLLGGVGVALYLPFYIGFSSQAGGILPNILNPTRGVQLWVMFGTLFVPVFLFLGHAVRSQRGSLGRGIGLSLSFALLLWALTWLIIGGVQLVPGAVEQVLASLGADSGAAVIEESLSRRFSAIGGVATLVVLIGLGLATLLPDQNSHQDRPPVHGNAAYPFIILLILIGGLLVLVPEFFYLRDLFSTRMNTVFKFYYQAWLFWSLAAAFGTAALFQKGSGVPGLLRSAVIIGALGIGLVYPVLSLQTKTNQFSPGSGFQLDGTLHGAYLSQDDQAAVAWFHSQPVGPLVESVGGSYSGHGRISAHTGIPALLGWPFHQNQWRGGYEEVGSREGDIERIYRSSNWEEVKMLLDQYQVRYIYVGSLERTRYAVNDAKFYRNLDVAFEQGSVVVFEYEPSPTSSQ